MHLPRSLRALAGLWLAIAWAASVQAADTFGSAYLAEFLADNQKGLKDDDGERVPWVELHNGGGSVVNLAGWFLTDSPTNLTKWRFPAVGLAPDKQLIVFVSGKNRTTNLLHLHTNFRLEKQGGYLALVNQATNVVSEFAPYPAQIADVSYGRVRGEPRLRGTFVKPTPGKHNASSGKGFASDVVFSRPSGNFTAPFTLELSCPGAGNVIRFTGDGKLPTTNSPAYTAPISITNSTQLRARAYRDGVLPGPPHSEVYVFLNTNVASFVSTVPVLVMETFGRDMPALNHGQAVHLSFFEPVNGKTMLTNRPTLITRAGYRIRGSTSGGMPQSNFAVHLLDEFNEETDRAVLGLPADSDWILYGPNEMDRVMIHNTFVHQLSRDLGHYSPRTRFLEVFWVRNPGAVTEAHYNGVYVLEEKIKIHKHRVNIDRIKADDLQPPAVTGGYLLKFDRPGPNEGGFGGMVYDEPKELVINLPQRAPQKRYLNTFFNEFEAALNGPHWKDAQGYRAFFDVEAGIDFHVLEVLSGNVDSLALSTFFYKPRGGKVTFGPHWDFDRALGSTDGRDANPRVWNTGPFFGARWWSRLVSDPDFWQLWVDRWQELRQTHFSLPNLHALIDRQTGEVREAVPRDYKRWSVVPRGGSFQGEVDLMKNWISNRVDFIDSQLVQPPRVTRQGTEVTFTVASTNATVYYTLDGSDPRLAQGGLSSNALAYAAPIQLKNQMRVIARARDPKQRQSGGPPVSTPWSRPVSVSIP